MDLLRTLLSRCVSFFRRKQLDEDLDEELHAHIDISITENMTLGMSRQEARTKALREFGGLAQVKETYRVHRGLPLLDQIGRDLQYGLRQLHRSPGFAATAILTLALGLGANTAVFSLINALLLRPLPVPRADRLEIIESLRTDFDEPNDFFSAPMFRALEKRHQVFEDVAVFRGDTLQLHGASGRVEASGALVSGQFFPMLQTPPLLGRALSPLDDLRGNANSVVISESFWRSWFNGAPDVVGRKLTIANSPFTVVGVMPARFIGADPTLRPAIYIPLSAEPIVDAPIDMIAAGEHILWLNILARRNPDISEEQANAELRAISNPVLEESVTDASQLKSNREHHFQLLAEPGSLGHSYLREQFRKPLTVVFSLCGAMLLLACLNLASLLMARAAARERELATRLAIGATRTRLIQQLLIESLLLASLGTLSGLAVSPVISHLLATFLIGSSRETVVDTSLDVRVYLFAALITALTALLIGLLPALRATSVDLNHQIKNGSQTSAARDRRRLLPRLLLTSEVGLALMLVIGAGLLAASLTRLYRVGLGFDPKGVVQLNFDMSKQGLAGDPLLHWYQDLSESIAHQPGVKGVTFAMSTPLGGNMGFDTLRTALSNGDKTISMNTVSPDYFATMRVPIVSGRDFRWQDTKSEGSKIILNQTAARILFPNRNPIGQSVSDYDKTANKVFAVYEVIAVVGDTKERSIRQEAPPGAFTPMTQNEWDKAPYTALIRLDGPTTPFAAATRSLMARMAPDVPAPAMTTMSGALDDSIRSERMMAMLSVFFAACALLVTAIGLYGTLAYATARRTSEIGIRMALGAQRLQVVSLVFRENAWIALCGCAAGLIAASFASRILASFLYGTSTRDPWVLIGSVASLISIASAASLLPAMRAARIDPMEALRTE